MALDSFGEGPSRDELEALAARLGVQDVAVFHGLRPFAEIERALASSDVYVSVAESDGASVALLEAMALGSIPVVSDIPANRAWIEDGVNGILTAIEPTAVAEGLERALGLDRAAVRAANAELIGRKGDLQRNLSALEVMLRELVRATLGAADRPPTRRATTYQPPGNVPRNDTYGTA